MDYTQAPLLFKLQKVGRYISLYGISRTFAKIKAQYHMKAHDGFDGPRWVNLHCKDPDAPDRNIALIGCGNYAYSTLAYYLRKHNPKFLRATYDLDKGRARSLCQTYGGCMAHRDWDAIAQDAQIKLVFIATNHASHAEYAVACIEAGKHVHIEKPHVVSKAQLDRLIAAMRRSPESKVFLGFNRPRSRLFRRLQDVLKQETGPLMINWFIAGHAIPDDHWYFDEKEGGRVLGNLCHWTDLTLHLVTLDKAFPCTIIPASPPQAKSDYVVSIIFADQSCASITFSAKGHTFEGVREILNVHKGNVLASLTDFQQLTYEVTEKKYTISLRHRDHGHEANIVHSLKATQLEAEGEPLRYVESTARFFLAIREAIDTGERVVLSM